MNCKMKSQCKPPPHLKSSEIDTLTPIVCQTQGTLTPEDTGTNQSSLIPLPARSEKLPTSQQSLPQTVDKTKERYLEHRINLRTKSSSWGFRIDHIYSPDPSSPYVGKFETPDRCSHLQKATTLHYGFKRFKTMYPSGKGFNPQTHQEEGTFQELFNQAIIRDSPTVGTVPWTKRYSNWARNERRRIKRIVKQWHHEEERGTIYSEDPYMGSWLQVCRDL